MSEWERITPPFGVGKPVRQLRTLAAHLKDFSSIPNTHGRHLTTICYLQLQEIWWPFVLWGHLYTCSIHSHRWTLMHVTRMINFYNYFFWSFYEITTLFKKYVQQCLWERTLQYESFMKMTFHTKPSSPALVFHCGLVLTCHLLWSTETGPCCIWSRFQLLNLCRWCKLQILFSLYHLNSCQQRWWMKVIRIILSSERKSRIWLA